MSKKKKAAWGWAPAKQTFKPTDAQKKIVSEKFEPLLEKIRQGLPPVPEPQKFNHCVDVFSKWWRSYFYIMQKYKCPPEGYISDGFETGVARMEFRGDDTFDLAYFRHTGKWWVIAEGISLEECLDWVKTDPIFTV